jgi:N-acetyl-gamma-glutamyl-phosphate reductase
VIRYALLHPQLELGALESRSHSGTRVGDHFPLLRALDRRFDTPGSVLNSVTDGDVVVTAGVPGEALTVVPGMLRKGARVVDLSADYRFTPSVVYGLSEWNHREIAAAALVANPGCYPTAAALALLPIQSVAKPCTIVIDAKSGISGAGRKPTIGALFVEVAGDVRAYGLSGHRHQAEIERTLLAHAITAPVTFTPHVVPIARGMLVDAYAIFTERVDAEAVLAAYERAYKGSTFVRILNQDVAPSVSAVNGTNNVELRIDVIGSTVRIICAIDNLGKGAAGQAIQNVNVMLGLPEEMGLHAGVVVT